MDAFNEIVATLRLLGTVKIAYRTLHFAFEGCTPIGHVQLTPSGAVVLLPWGDEKAYTMKKSDTASKIAAQVYMRAVAHEQAVKAA
jgi:hypothetical protein